MTATRHCRSGADSAWWLWQRNLIIFFLRLAVRADTTYIKFFTVYPEPLRTVICCQSVSGEPVNPSRFPNSQHRAVSFQQGLPTENALDFSWKKILPIPKDLLQYSPK